MIRKPSSSTQRRALVNVLARVRPSPVGVAIVRVVKPSELTPKAAVDGAFFVKIVVLRAFAAFVMLR